MNYIFKRQCFIKEIINIVNRLKTRKLSKISLSTLQVQKSEYGTQKEQTNKSPNLLDLERSHKTNV